MNRSKYLWLTDTHIKFFGRYKLLNTILDQKPNGVFITGDISEGFTFLSDLEFLGQKIGRPFYFVRGNHELWGSSFDKVNEGIRKLSAQYSNLIWMTDAGIVPLNEETCLIGMDGWYDARLGNEKYIKYTFDWWLIEDFRKLPSMKERIEKMRFLADESARVLSSRLEEAVETYKTVYLLTHVPAWREAHRANGWISDKFYEPYNTNLVLGQALESVMSKHKKRQLIVLCGHTHQNMTVHVSRNIECRVGKGSYRKISEEEIIYI
jgi:3',5'-cyclic-AMP phosphodiesterase